MKKRIVFRCEDCETERQVDAQTLEEARQKLEDADFFVRYKIGSTVQDGVMVYSLSGSCDNCRWLYRQSMVGCGWEGDEGD